MEMVRYNNDKRLELPGVNKYNMIMKPTERREVKFGEQGGSPWIELDGSQSIPCLSSEAGQCMSF